MFCGRRCCYVLRSSVLLCSAIVGAAVSRNRRCCCVLQSLVLLSRTAPPGGSPVHPASLVYSPFSSLARGPALLTSSLEGQLRLLKLMDAAVSLTLLLCMVAAACPDLPYDHMVATNCCPLACQTSCSHTPLSKAKAVVCTEAATTPVPVCGCHYTCPCGACSYACAPAPFLQHTCTWYQRHLSCRLACLR